MEIDTPHFTYTVDTTLNKKNLEIQLKHSIFFTKNLFGDLQFLHITVELIRICRLVNIKTNRLLLSKVIEILS